MKQSLRKRLKERAYISWNDKDVESIKKAERNKRKFEKKGYTLIETIAGSIPDNWTLIYAY